MIRQITLLALFIATVGMLPSGLQAQYDDLYYNPDEQQPQQSVYTSSQNDRSDDLVFGESHDQYDDQAYENFNDYDFYYTSRIRRFHRTHRSLDFYDPYYVDLAYYGYRTPGVTIYISPSNFYHHRRPMYGYNSWHHYDPFYNPYHSWYRPFRPYYSYNSFGFGYGYNSWGGYGYSNCPVYYANNNYYVNNYYQNNNQDRDNNQVSDRGTYYGPRNSTGSTAPRNGRVAEDEAGLRSNESSGILPAETERRRDSRTSEDSGNRVAGSERADRSGQTSTIPQRRTEQSSRTSGTTAAVPTASREAQNRFSNNRVSRDEASIDTRTNVPRTQSNDRSTSTPRGVFGNSRSTDYNSTTPNTRRSTRGSGVRDQNSGTRTSPDFNRPSRRSNNTSTTINRGSNQRSSGSSVTPSRSNTNRSSNSVSPSRSNRSSNSSGTSTSGSSNKSKRGGGR